MGIRDADQRDRELLRTFAKGVVVALSDIGEHRVSSLVFSAVKDTDGFGAFLGYVRGSEIWILLDRYSGHETRQPWVGVFVKSERQASRIAGHLKRYSRTPRFVQPTEMVMEGRLTRLKRPLRVAEFGQVCVDLFSERGMAVGMHIRRIASGAPLSEGSMTATARLIADIVLAIVGPSRGQRLGAGESVTLRRSQVSRVVRDRKQAALVKRRDRYTCRICSYRPELQYGAVGRMGLDAHHLDELARHRKPKSSVARMITVCAACHRVLHRLPPRERDLGSLKKRFGRSFGRVKPR